MQEPFLTDSIKLKGLDLLGFIESYLSGEYPLRYSIVCGKGVHVKFSSECIVYLGLCSFVCFSNLIYQLYVYRMAFAAA